MFNNQTKRNQDSPVIDDKIRTFSIPNTLGNRKILIRITYGEPVTSL
ncbi:MAG: hypothetical protein ACRD8K_02400 [Nitrososphaeraceae archaeon]